MIRPEMELVSMDQAGPAPFDESRSRDVDGSAQRTAEITLSQLMLPTDANPAGNVHGGVLMKLADTAGGVAATRHARARVVTAVMDSMTFEQPVYVGDLVIVHARVTWAGRTSMETRVTIDAESVATGECRRVSTAYFVYVALDAEGRPLSVPAVKLETEQQRRDWEEAEARRAHRLMVRERARAADAG